MTGPHVEAETLAAYCDGTIGDRERGAVREHLESCVECRDQVADFRRLENLVDQSRPEDEALGPAAAVTPGLDRALDGVIDDEVRGRHGRFRIWRGLAAATTAVAAGIAIWIGLRTDVPQGPVGLTGAAVFERSSEAWRGAADSTIHFEVSVDRATHLAIFSVSGSSVELLYPHADALLESVAPKGAFEPGRRERIPATALADWTATESRASATFLAVPMAERPTVASLATVIADLKLALPSGTEAVRERLRSRFGSVVELPRR